MTVHGVRAAVGGAVLGGVVACVGYSAYALYRSRTSGKWSSRIDEESRVHEVVKSRS